MTERAGKRSIAIAEPFIGESELEAVQEPLRSGWLTQGPKVAEFERQFAERHAVGHGVAVTSCTTGLHLALAGLGVGPGDEVLVPAFTWVATAAAVRYVGADPVLCDVDPETYNLDPAELAARVTPRTKAVIPVHLFGLCADIDALRSALPAEVAIVEDAACAAGAGYHDRPAGGLGDAASFSFHPRKSITTGEGGMVTTDDDELAERLRMLRNHGASVSEEDRHAGPAPWRMPAFEVLGFNFRMTDMQGAVGLVQLGRLDELLSERDEWAQLYKRELADLGWLRAPAVPEGYDHGWQSFVAVIGEGAPAGRDQIMESLQEQGISTRPGTHAVSELGYWRRELQLESGSFPVATMLERQTIALPLHNRMDGEDFEYVVEALRRL